VAAASRNPPPQREFPLGNIYGRLFSNLQVDLSTFQNQKLLFVSRHAFGLPPPLTLLPRDAKKLRITLFFPEGVYAFSEPTVENGTGSASPSICDAETFTLDDFFSSIVEKSPAPPVSALTGLRAKFIPLSRRVLTEGRPWFFSFETPDGIRDPVPSSRGREALSLHELSGKSARLSCRPRSTPFFSKCVPLFFPRRRNKSHCTPVLFEDKKSFPSD